MSRLIDADALLEGREDHEMISTHLIWNAPTIDAVEVVRCKDCKFASYEPCKDFVNVYVCNYSYWTRAQGGRYPDWYCARAERRTDAVE